MKSPSTICIRRKKLGSKSEWPVHRIESTVNHVKRKKKILLKLQLQCINWKALIFKHAKYLHFKLKPTDEVEKKNNCVRVRVCMRIAIAYQLNLCDMLFPPQWVFQFGSIRCQKIITVHDDMYKCIDCTEQCAVATYNFMRFFCVCVIIIIVTKNTTAKITLLHLFILFTW